MDYHPPPPPWPDEPPDDDPGGEAAEAIALVRELPSPDEKREGLNVLSGGPEYHLCTLLPPVTAAFKNTVCDLDYFDI